MLLSKKVVLWIVLCAVVFSATVPVLLGLGSDSYTTFGGGDYVVITQIAKNDTLKERLASDIAGQEFVEDVSPEIYAFSSVIAVGQGGTDPVLVRGAWPENLLRFEGADVVKGSLSNGTEFGLVGERLANRLGVTVGDDVTVVGSLSPTMVEFTVTGIFRTESLASDEIVLPLPVVRKMTALGEEDVLIIKVRTRDRARLEEYMEGLGESAVVGGSGQPGTTPGSPSEINPDKTEQEEVAEELAFKYLDQSQRFNGSESVMSQLVQRGIGSIGVVIYGFIALNGALIFMGIVVVFTRNIIERRKDLGVLHAIGASKPRINLILLREIAVLTFLSSLIGVVMGFVVTGVMNDMNVILAFGHTIRANLGVELFAFLLVATTLIGCGAGAAVTTYMLRSNPAQLMSETTVAAGGNGAESLVETLDIGDGA